MMMIYMVYDENDHQIYAFSSLDKVKKYLFMFCDVPESVRAIISHANYLTDLRPVGAMFGLVLDCDKVDRYPHNREGGEK